ncbi:MAG: hypothetical protein JXR73_15240 [Candidatus Omnitrophica bacterium]|nr:hypothetical protein [Candidatus Omnitrophota bacterium]
MESKQSTMDAFHPEDAMEQIPRLIGCCAKTEQKERGHTIVVFLDGESLSDQEIGRAAIISGKCRSQKIKLILACSDSIFRQLTDYGLDRVIWTKRQEDLHD